MFENFGVILSSSLPVDALQTALYSADVQQPNWETYRKGLTFQTLDCLE